MKLKKGIKLIEETVGIGEIIKKDDVVEIELNMWLNNGEQVLKAHRETYRVGSRKMISGIEYTLEGMRKSGKCKVKISPHLAYGKEGVAETIPPNSVLICEILLV
ncbi:MAG: Unknown protein [uncultured Sulfurovum sp.]|uniref:Peptidyl-prolyl cis-trans isomerase n=1 Tax=uncultured Sulfurovum sp. TaxID=269237 RepID=A0A6S6SWE5_9BACT|nr:MAG: Unknown protein [uncultured Sulfurovum sp.]